MVNSEWLALKAETDVAFQLLFTIYDLLFTLK
jgi:hypothetical protein